MAEEKVAPPILVGADVIEEFGVFIARFQADYRGNRWAVDVTYDSSLIDYYHFPVDNLRSLISNMLEPSASESEWFEALILDWLAALPGG